MSVRIPTPRFEVNFEDDALVTAYPNAIAAVSPAPVFWWRLDETAGTNAADSGTASVDGTYTGGFTLNVGGPFSLTYDIEEPAVLFNGSTGWVNIPNSATMAALSSAWTLAAWVYPTATRNTAVTAVIGAQFASPRHAFMLGYGAATGTGAPTAVQNAWVGAYDGAGAGWSYVGDPDTLPLNTWSHIAGVWDGTERILYRNGIEIARSAGVSVAGTAGGAGIGSVPGGGFFPGAIDEVAIWSSALTAEQIAPLGRYFTINEPDEANFIDLTAEPDTVNGQELSRLKSFSPRRGRSDPVNRIEAGTATVILGNNDGLLSPAPIVNMLPNPSAEDDTTGLPLKGQDGTLIYDATHVRSGESAWKLTTGASIPGYATSEQEGLIGMRPGKTYTFSAYLYVPTGVTLSNVRVEIVDEIAGSEDVASTSTPAALDAYHRLEVTKTIRDAADASFVRVRLNEASDSIWFDDIQLEEAASASAYVDGNSTDAAWLGEPDRSPTVYRTGGYAKAGIPMRACRLTAEWDGDDYDVFHGYIEQMQFSFPASGHDARVTYSIVDGTRVLANMSMRGFARSSERSGDRIRAILAWVGISDARMDVDDQWIDTLALDSVATVDDDRSALSMIREIEETERGEFFVSRGGLFTYQGSLFRSTSGVEVVVFSDEDDTAEIRYSDVAMKIDIGTVANDVNIENVASGNVHEFNYTASQGRYFPISRSEQSLWDQDEASDEDRSIPFPNAEGVTVLGVKDPDDWWPTLLGLELGDLARIERHHAGEDLWQGYVHFLEGYSVDASPDRWTMNLLTSPQLAHPISADVWQTPISRPLLFTSKSEIAYGGGTITMPSKTYGAGRLYLLFANLWGSGGTPVQPGFTSGNTWTSVNSATSSGVRHQLFYAQVGGADVTEALQLTFGGQAPTSVYDIVIVEVAAGFLAASPIGDTATGTASLGQYGGYIDVGTLTDAESIVVAGALKAANDPGTWSAALTLYARGAGSVAYSVVYGRVPGVDTVSVAYGNAGGWGGIGVEIEAS